MEDTHENNDPVLTLHQDYLDREKLAKEIIQAIFNFRSAFALKIGLFGEEGSGKTTLLHFLQELAQCEKLAFVWFNPHRFQQANELWSNFYARLLETLQTNHFDLKNAFPGFCLKKYLPAVLFKFRTKYDFSSLSNTINQYIDSHLEDSARQFVSDQLHANSALFKDIQKKLQGKKIIITVDDIDLMQPKLIIPFFFALRDFLNLPCFAFILSVNKNKEISTEIAGQVSRNTGQVLLKQMLNQFYVLEEPALDQIEQLFLANIANIEGLYEHLDMKILKSFLPKNPKHLLAIIHHIKSLKKELFYPEDLQRSWRLIVFISILQEESRPIFLKTLEALRNPNYLKILTLNETEDSQEQINQKITQILAVFPNLSLEKRNQIEGLLKEIFKNYSHIQKIDSKAYSLLMLFMSVS